MAKILRCNHYNDFQYILTWFRLLLDRRVKTFKVLTTAAPIICSFVNSDTPELLIKIEFLADRTNGRAYATVLRLSSSVTLCIVSKQCVLEQKLLLRAYRKSYMRNRLVPKSMTSTFV